MTRSRLVQSIACLVFEGNTRWRKYVLITLGPPICNGRFCIVFQIHLEEEPEQVLPIDTRRAQHPAPHQRISRIRRLE